MGSVIVDPNYSNRGIGKKLMSAIEKCFEGIRFELFTGHRSEKNLALYQKLGYKEYKTEQVAKDLQFMYMRKNSSKA